MTDHSIKINRALRLSTIGSCPGSARAMLDYVPAAVISALPARAIAELIDSSWQATQDAKALAARQALDEGAIWDDRSQALREIAA